MLQLACQVLSIFGEILLALLRASNNLFITLECPHNCFGLFCISSTKSQWLRTRLQPGLEPDHTIWPCYGLEISGPHHSHLVLSSNWSYCGPGHRTRQRYAKQRVGNKRETVVSYSVESSCLSRSVKYSTNCKNVQPFPKWLGHSSGTIYWPSEVVIVWSWKFIWDQTMTGRSSLPRWSCCSEISGQENDLVVWSCSGPGCALVLLHWFWILNSSVFYCIWTFYHKVIFNFYILQKITNLEWNSGYRCQVLHIYI